MTKTRFKLEEKMGVFVSLLLKTFTLTPDILTYFVPRL